MSISKTYTFNCSPFRSDRYTVVQMKNGKFLEVHRGPAAFRAANPDIKQRVFNSLQEWHATFYDIVHTNVLVWEIKRDWAPTAIPEEDETSYWLDFQLSTFMGGASATEEQLSDAIEDFSVEFPDSPFLTFLLGKNPYEVIESGDILTALEENGHILDEPVEWPSIRTWQKECLADLKLSDSAEFTFSPEMTCFTEHLTGNWAGVLKAFRSYGLFYKSTFQKVLKVAGIHDAVELTGYIYTDYTLRTFFGLNDHCKGFLSFSDFRKQMLERGHLMATTAAPSLLVVDLNVATGERTVVEEEDDDASELSDDSDDSDYVPSESDSDADDSDDSDSCSDMEIDEEAVVKKDLASLKQEALDLVADTLAYATRWQKEHPLTFNLPKELPTLPRVSAPLSFKDVVFAEEPIAADTKVTDPFAEIHAVFFRVQDELVDPDNAGCYKARLATQFIEFCMRPSFTRLWRSNAFERLQMRATLQEWTDCSFGEEFPALVAVAKRFMATYPA